MMLFGMEACAKVSTEKTQRQEVVEGAQRFSQQNVFLVSSLRRSIPRAPSSTKARNRELQMCMPLAQVPNKRVAERIGGMNEDYSSTRSVHQRGLARSS